MKSVVDVMLDLWMPIAENWISSNVKFVLQVVPNTLYFCWKWTLVDFSRWSIYAFETNYRSPLTTKACVCSPWVWCDNELFHRIEHIFMPIKFLCFWYKDQPFSLHGQWRVLLTNMTAIVYVLVRNNLYVQQHFLAWGMCLWLIWNLQRLVGLSLWNISWWCKVDLGM